jgi:ribosomal protein S12 methylthiotransferase
MKIGFVSLGCPKNLVDSEVMLGLVERAGHEITADAAAADVLVVNTCAFIESAKQESIDTILELADHKKTGRCERLVVTGCLAERYRDELAREIPEIDALLGTGEVPDIIRAVEAPGPSGAAPIRLFRPGDFAPAAPPSTPAERTLPTYLYDADTPRRLSTARHFAYVKVAEGCDYACAFCIIPALRGPYRSRSTASVVAETRSLARQGVREIILVSQDTTFYGIDRGERGALARLLRELNEIEDLRWIRLLYLYPTTITDEVLDAMAECDKVCRYVDLPLQHASTEVLRRMGRPGNRDQYLRLLERIRTRVPDVTLRTTFIVGFPGETEADVETLCRFVAEVRFEHVGVFTYSHEEGTAAYGLADEVAPREKEARRRAVMTLQKRVVRELQRSRIGTILDLMVDGPSPAHELLLQARLPGQAPEIDPVVYLTDCAVDGPAPGSLIRARITGANGYDLVAAPLT